MKIDFSQKLIGADGKPLMGEKGVPFEPTLGDIAAQALNSPEPREPLAYTEAMRRGELGWKVKTGGIHDMLDADVKLIRDLLPRVYPSLIVFAASKLMDAKPDGTLRLLPPTAAEV